VRETKGGAAAYVYTKMAFVFGAWRGHLHGRSGEGQGIGYHGDVWLRARLSSQHSYILSVSFSIATCDR